jgi:hypothetical protein
MRLYKPINLSEPFDRGLFNLSKIAQTNLSEPQNQVPCLSYRPQKVCDIIDMR